MKKTMLSRIFAAAAGLFGVHAVAEVVSNATSMMGLGLARRYEIECVGPNGEVKWVEYVDNMITDAGLNDMIDQYYNGAGYTAAHFVYLILGAGASITIGAGDTMNSHGGWTEATDYTGNRQALVMGAAVGGVASNSASKAVFPITGPMTVGGAGICTEDSGNAGSNLSIGGGAFTGLDKNVDALDTLNVTMTMTLTSV